MEMQKNPDKNFTTLEIDPISGAYYVRLPEWVVSEYGWYEGTPLNVEIDNNALIITEIVGR